MNPSRILLTNLLLIVLLGLQSGCTRHPNVGGRSTLWSHSSGKEDVPGLDEASISWGTWDDKVVFVVWGDRSAFRLASGYPNPDNRRIRFRGTIDCRDGREVVYEVEAAEDGTPGTLRFAKQSYQLADGGLFLVSTQGEQPLVKQLKRDLAQMKLENSELRALSRTDDEIRGFFKDAGKAK